MTAQKRAIKCFVQKYAKPVGDPCYTLLDSGLSEARIYDQTGFSGATIGYVHSQYHFNPPNDAGDDPLKLTMANINY